MVAQVVRRSELAVLDHNLGTELLCTGEKFVKKLGLVIVVVDKQRLFERRRGSGRGQRDDLLWRRESFEGETGNHSIKALPLETFLCDFVVDLVDVRQAIPIARCWVGQVEYHHLAVGLQVNPILLKCVIEDKTDRCGCVLDRQQWKRSPSQIEGDIERLLAGRGQKGPVKLDQLIVVNRDKRGVEQWRLGGGRWRGGPTCGRCRCGGWRDGGRRGSRERYRCIDGHFRLGCVQSECGSRDFGGNLKTKQLRVYVRTKRVQLASDLELIVRNWTRG